VPDYDEQANSRPRRESEAPDAGKLVKRYERGLERRGTVDTMQQRILEYLIPWKADITRIRVEGSERGEKVWDSTAIQANKLLASSIQGSLMSQAIRWFRLVLRNQDLMTKQVTDWLERVVEILYQSLRQSNFYAEASELCLDIGAIGIGAMFVEERKKLPGQDGFGGFLFRTIGGKYVIEENAEGRVDTFFRCFQMSVRNIVDAWNPATLPDAMTSALRDKPDKEFEVLHAVYPRRVDNPKRKDAQHMRWASCYLHRSSKVILNEGGYEEFPYMVPRWDKESEGIYGYGPGHIALYDIRTLSRVVELGLSAGSKAIDPPGLVNSDAVFGTLDITPASMNPVDGDPRLAWMPMESGAKFDIGQLLERKYESKIERMFYWDQLQLQGDKLMTATEVERRLELMRRVLGPTLGRFESELLSPLLNRCFGLMYRAGALPPPPEELSGQDLDIEYEGPLARSQKATRLAASDEVMGKIAQIATFAPEQAVALLDNFDLDDWIRDQATIAGLPSENLADEQQRDQVRQQRAQAAAQRQKVEQMQMLAEGAGKVAPFMDSLQAMKAGANGKAA
jgi:Bacteriophage head to tail connecting protein